MLKRLYISLMSAVALMLGTAVSAFAEGLTMPVIPTTDLYTAGTAILGLVAVAVVIAIVVRVFKKA